MKKRNIYIMLYDHFADFEVVLAALLLRNENLIYYGFDKLNFESETKLKVTADKLLSDLNPEECDLFIIPGGEPKHLIKDPAQKEHVEKLNEILNALNHREKKIAAICGGPTFLANSGILNGKKCTASIQDDERLYFSDAHFEDVDFIRDGNILTAQGHAFTDFAIQVCKMVNFFENERDAEDTLKWIKNVKE